MKKLLSIILLLSMLLSASACSGDKADDKVTVKNTLHKEVWMNWGERFENWMGQPIPDNAPIPPKK